MPSLCRLTVLLVTALLGWHVACADAAHGTDQVPWAPTLADAQKIAAEQNKLVLVHFYNDHCPPCELVEREVFTQPRVAEALARNYVPVKVHAGAQPKVAEQFRVDRWPTDIICTPAGHEIMRATSPKKAEAYVGLVDQVAMQTGVGASRQWQTSMQAVGQQVLDAQGPQAQVGTGQATGAAQGYLNQTAGAAQGFANQANSTFQAYTAQANRWNQQVGAAAQQANSTAQQQLGNTTQQIGNTAQQIGNTAQQLGNSAQQMGTTWRSAGQDLRMSWNAGAVAAAAPLPQPTGAPAESPYAQFAQSQAGPASPTAAPPPVAAAPPPVTAAPPQPSLPTANPFISGSAPLGPPPATVAQQPSTQQPSTQQPSAQQPSNQQPSAQQPSALQHRAEQQGPQPVATGPAASEAPSPPAGSPAPAPATGNSLGSMNQVTGNSPPTLTLEQGLIPADKAPPIALEGYCPVTLVEQGKWKRSDPQFGAIHLDRTYLFASKVEQDKFLANPDAYSAVLSGNDPVIFAQQNQLVDGKRSYGLKYKRQIYLFANEASLQAFTKNPQAFAETARQARIQAENGSKLR